MTTRAEAPDPHGELAASDPAIARLIAEIDSASIESRMRDRDTDRFVALARIVTGQQVSTAAARTIWGRVVDAFGGAPSAEEIAADGAEDRLRGAGLSGRKASYIIGIAEAIVAGELRPDELDGASDEEVIETLVALRGLGRWSAEMFLIFDLGLRHGIRIAYGMDGPPTPEEAVAIAERWAPHRSLASLYLWEAVGIGLPVAVAGEGT